MWWQVAVAFHMKRSPEGTERKRRAASFAPFYVVCISSYGHGQLTYRSSINMSFRCAVVSMTLAAMKHPCSFEPTGAVGWLPVGSPGPDRRSGPATPIAWAGDGATAGSHACGYIYLY